MDSRGGVTLAILLSVLSENLTIHKSIFFLVQNLIIAGVGWSGVGEKRYCVSVNVLVVENREIAITSTNDSEEHLNPRS